MAGCLSGLRALFRRSAPRLKVTKIRFDSGIDIWYAVFPDRDVTHLRLPPGRQANTALPAIEQQPPAGQHHWEKQADSRYSLHNWPAVYVKQGAAGAPSYRLVVSFMTTDPTFGGNLSIKATSNYDVTIREENVNFVGGQANNKAFVLENLPNTVKWLKDIRFTWKYKTAAMGSFNNANRTQHTLFILDEEPCDNLQFNPDPTYGYPPAVHADYQNNFHLFETFYWSCKWADGKTGTQEVLDAIWSEFNPVRRRNHSTGLVYWKNYEVVAPAHYLQSALRNKLDPDPNVRGAASCWVFNNIFIYCLGAHGIVSTEINLRVRPLFPAVFPRNGHNYKCRGWDANTIIGQGNTNAPDDWSDHRITAVNTPGGIWKLYDPSYGIGDFQCAQPNFAAFLDINSNYELQSVQRYKAENVDDPAHPANEKLDPNPALGINPHIKGEKLIEYRP